MSVIYLWAHQQDILPDMMAGHHFLAWEPGVGKTGPALYAGAVVGGRQLYVCTATIRNQIEEEARWVVPERRVQILRTTKDRIDATADIVVVSYDMLIAMPIWRQAMKLDWGSIVMDEAHRIKNREAKRTRALYGARTTTTKTLWRRSKHVWPMSGTPILNDPSELWTHYSRLFPEAILNEEGQPLNYKEWEAKFCKTADLGYGEKIVGGKNLDELREILAPYMSVLRLEDVFPDMPKRIVSPVPLEGAALSLEGIPEELLEDIERAIGRGEPPEEIFNPAVSTLRKRVAMAKAPTVARMIRDELEGGQEKVILFGWHPDALKLVAEALADRATVTVTGEVNGIRRELAIQQFRNNPECRVFIGQITAAGEGLNLQFCDRVIFLDAAWSPGTNEQAIRRAHRAGQTRPVRVSFCSLKGSIDERVQKVLADKAKIINEVFGE